MGRTLARPPHGPGFPGRNDAWWVRRSDFVSRMVVIIDYAIYTNTPATIFARGPASMSV